MEEKKIDERITTVLGDGKKREDVVLLLEHLHAGASECSKNERRLLLSIFVTWAAANAIAIGIVSEGGVLNFKIEKVQSLLIIFPPLAAALSYAFIVAISGLNLRTKAIEASYQILMPKFNEERLFNIIAPATFMNLERFIYQATKSTFRAKINEYWTTFLTVLFTFGVLIVNMHISYLCWIYGGWHWAYSTLSLFVSFILIVRSTIIALTIDDF